MNVLFVGPGGDDVANILRDVGQQVRLAIPAASPLNVVALWDSAADRAAVDAELANNPHIMYFGHGYDDELGDPPLVDDANVGKASGRIVLAMGCSSASQLGADAVSSNGVDAYLGFTRPVFIPVSLPTWSLTPWYVAGTQLATGATAGTVEAEMRQALCNEGDRIYINLMPDEDSAANDMLVHYGMALTFVCLGDSQATI